MVSGFLPMNTSKKPGEKTEEPYRVINGEALMEELEPSRGKTGGADPTTCTHPTEVLRFRANSKMSWGTCTMCGVRWRRIPWQEHAGTDQETMTVG
eukprot:215814-Amphidinium_carterae.1